MGGVARLGSSSKTRWPAPAIIRRRASGIVAAINRAFSAGDTGSSRPCTTSVRCATRCSQGHAVKVEIGSSW
jgi:hypothetical protein